MNEAHLGIALMVAVGLGVYAYYIKELGWDRAVFCEGAFGLWTIIGWFLAIAGAGLTSMLFTYITGVNPLG